MGFGVKVHDAAESVKVSSVGDLVRIWDGHQGEVVGLEDFDTPVGVLPVFHVNWTRTWTTDTPVANNTQTLLFTYDQITGFLVSAVIGGCIEGTAAEMVWYQNDSIASTNMHLPRFELLLPLFLLVGVMVVLSVIFLAFTVILYRRHLR